MISDAEPPKFCYAVNGFCLYCNDIVPDGVCLMAEEEAKHQWEEDTIDGTPS